MLFPGRSQHARSVKQNVPEARFETTPSRRPLGNYPVEHSRWAEHAVEAAGGDLLVGSDGCDSGADGVEVGERVALGADEELHERLHHGGVRKVDAGDEGRSTPSLRASPPPPMI
jgi:hypothetical protein